MTHQGMNGCSPRGLHIPRNEQFTFNSYRPVLTFVGPPINLDLNDPIMDRLRSSIRLVPPSPRITELDDPVQEECQSRNNTSPSREVMTAPQVTPLLALIPAEEMSPPLVAREAETPQMAQAFNDALQIGSKSAPDPGVRATTNVPLFGQAPSTFPGAQIIGNQTNPVNTEVNAGMSNQTAISTSQVLGGAAKASTFPQKNVFPNTSTPSPPQIPEAREAVTPQRTQAFPDALQIGSNSAADTGVRATTNVPLFGQPPSMFSGAQIFGNQTNPVKPEVNAGMANQTAISTSSQVFRAADGASTSSFIPQKNVFSNPSTAAANPDTNTGMLKQTPVTTSSKVLGGAAKASTFSLFPQKNVFANAPTAAANLDTNYGMSNQTPVTTSSQVLGGAAKASTFSFVPQKNVFPNTSTPSPPQIPEAREAETPQMTQALSDAVQTGSNSAADTGVRATTNVPLFGQAPSTFSGAQIFDNQTNPVNTEVNPGMANQTAVSKSSQVFGTAAGASTFSFVPQKNVFSNPSTAADNPDTNSGMSNQTSVKTSSKVFGTAAGASTFSSVPQKNVFPNTSTQSPPQIPEAREAETPQRTQTFSDAVQIGSNSAADAGVRATTNVPLFGQAPSMFSGAQIFGNQTNPEVNAQMSNQTPITTSSKVLGGAAKASTFSVFPQKNVFANPPTVAANPDTNFGMSNQTPVTTSSKVLGGAAEASTFSFVPQKNVSPNTSTPSPPQIPEAREAETPQMTQSFADAVQIGSNSAPDAGVRATTNVPLFGQAPSMFSGAQIFGNQTNPVNTEVNPGMANQTPISTSSQVFGTADGASTFSFIPQENVLANPSTAAANPDTNAGMSNQTPVTTSSQVLGWAAKASTFSLFPQKNVFPNTSTQSPPRIPEAKEAKTPQRTQTFPDALKTGSNSAPDAGVRATTNVPLFGQPPSMFSGTQIFGNQTNPVNTEVNAGMSNQTAVTTCSQVLEAAAGASTFSSVPQKNIFPNSSTPSPPRIHEAREAETPQITQALSNAVQIGSNSAPDTGVLATTNVPLFGQAPSMFSGAQIFGNQTNPVKPEVNAGMANQTPVSTSSPVLGVASEASTFSFVPQKNVFANAPTAAANPDTNSRMSNQTRFQTQPQGFGAAPRAFNSFGQSICPNPSQPWSPPQIPEAREAETPQMTPSFLDTLQIGSNSARDVRARNTANVPLFGQAPSLFPGTQIFGNPTNPVNPVVNKGISNQIPFQNSSQAFGTTTSWSTISFGAKQIPEAREAETPQRTPSFSPVLQIGSNSAADAGARSTSSAPLFGPTPSMFSGTKIFGNPSNSANTITNGVMSNQTPFQTPPQVFGAANRASTFSLGAQQNVFPKTSTPRTPPRIPVAREAETPQMTQTSADSLQIGSNSNRNFGSCDTTSAAQSSSAASATKISGKQTSPTNKEVNTDKTNRTLFETPQKVKEAATRVHRALDFSTGEQEVEYWGIPTTTAQETFTRQKKKEIDRAKAKRDKIRADLQTRVQKRELKMDRIKSSEMDCKCKLDAEWLEINNVFSDVLKVVEEARREALWPLEERSKKLQKEAHVRVQKLQKEINELKKSMDEVDQDQDPEVAPPMALDEPQSWKRLTLDTSFSFGSLRVKTSKLVESLKTTLEKLTSTELKRIPKFEVDVKLDPSSAHPTLDVSPNGKTVGFKEIVHRVPDCPQRFDLYGSILGINRLTSGKSYWEVEVKNKSGWDLGVASGNVKRKGMLSVNTDTGFWAIVHYDDKKYAALTVPPVSLALTVKPQKVGVFVDYDEGLVSFYDLTAKAHIYSFTDCSFSREVFPYFSPHLKQTEKNLAPLIISALNTQQ